MVVFPKQICKRFLPDTGEARSDKTFFLKTNMELEVCTSLGSMFYRRGALFVNEIRPANDAGWNGRKSPCCRPRVPCWCSWKWSFSRSNAGADCWWQRRMVVNSCRDQRWDRRVSFKFSISGRTSCACHLWVFSLQIKFFVRSKEGTKIGEFREKKCSITTLHPKEFGILCIFMGKHMLGTRARDWSAGSVHRL